MNHRIISVFVGGIALAMLFSAVPVYAQSPLDGVDDGEGTRQMELRRIAEEIEELEKEVNELSLRVNKYVLEQQALVLQEELERELAGLGAPKEAEEAVAVLEPVPAPDTGPAPVALVPDEPAQSSEAGFGGEDIFAGVEITEEAEEEQGFLAAVRSFGSSLGTPELVAVVILAALAMLILVRRLRSGRDAAGARKAPPSPENPAEQGRQELKERISWQ